MEKRKNSLIKTILIVIPLIIITLFLTLSFSINWIIETGVESFGTRMTGTDVQLNRSDVSLLSGKGGLSGVSIGNPEGFATEYALKLNEIKLAIDLSTLFSHKIIIEEIVINGPEITYEIKGTDSNIKSILKNIKSAGRESGKISDHKAEKDLNNDEKRVQINSLVIKNGRIHLSMSVLKGEKISLPLPDIHLKNIGKEKDGTPASEIFEEIYTSVYNEIDREVSQSTKGVMSGAKKALETLKGFFIK